MRSNIVRKSYRKSYTLYLLSEFKVNTDQVGDFALEALDDDSVYVRNNALQVINSKSSLDYMIQAFNKVNQGEKYFNSRIVVDFLDNFRGDTRILDNEILNKCDQFGSRASSIFIEHLTSTGNDDKRVRDSLLACMDSPVHKEKMIKLTRYFTHIVDGRAKEHILANMESEHWSLRANTATALGHYPGGDTVEMLRKALGDKNYFVRKNAAWSFVKLVPREEVLREIQINEDPFAQDLLKYTIESRVAYGNLGLVSFPYFLIFEYLTPFLEILGIVTLGLSYILNIINLKFFVLYLLVYIGYNIVISIISIITDLYIFGIVSSRGILGRMLVLSVLEGFGFRQLMSLFRIGNIFKGKKDAQWGEMERVKMD